MEKHLAIVKTPFKLDDNFQLTQKKNENMSSNH
jgi:hypothetical protein